ncbi:histidine kinase [Roseofilum reptotaenium CS-1145]|uniref:Histidine kinase n=1 Tax=Roseofilum reptotaenium AO1-A TaxID=1925591 RepID=A0A1L9QPU3_9CYAN|nr:MULTISPECIES: histidine kinase [Roseofilum]MBP0029544.1 histidine kinase [Roseofilum sp. Guam]MDB9516606.1 histidine kinase [Roseofilum reptotaenium CS-1145]OJJ24652.1 histidine kinase [Roseofilum reptotaenium AO1-A]
MAVSCHFIVEGNPVIVYASRNGNPKKVLPKLQRFLDTFGQERATMGETVHTPECLVAQIIVRFGFELCEDDFSNLRVGLKYDPDVDYLYKVGTNFKVTVLEPLDAYRKQPGLGLEGCQVLTEETGLAH